MFLDFVYSCNKSFVSFVIFVIFVVNNISHSSTQET
jgi:hypothetical protein